jgi:hypothetical protein
MNGLKSLGMNIASEEQTGTGTQEENTEDEATRPADWPSPLAKEAFHGIPGLIVSEIEPHSEADPAAHLLHTLAMFGNAIGPKPHFRVEDSKHRGNINVVIVGKSSRSRKGTSEGRIRRIFENAMPDWTKKCMTCGLSSGEGLIWAVRDAIEARGMVRGQLRNVLDDGVRDKRLLVSESEFSSALKVMSREGNTLSPVIRAAWDTGDLSTLTKNSPAKAIGAHISILGHITKEELIRHLCTTEMSNGFANRILWVCSKRSKLLPEGGNFRAEEHYDLYESLRDVIEHAQQVDEVSKDSDGTVEVYPALTKDAPGMLGSITSRAEAQVTRLSLLYALFDFSEEIAQEHLLAALAVWDYCEASVRCIFGDALGYPDADRILSQLRKTAIGLTRTDIRDLFLRNRSEAQIDAALSYLRQGGLAVSNEERTGGRPIERWLAT